MFRKVITLFTLVVMLTITVGPLFQSTVCNMPCCEELTVSCCEPDNKLICSSFIDCGEVGFTIVISAPIQKQYQQFDLKGFAIGLFTDFPWDYLLMVSCVENLSSYLLTHQNLPLLT